MSITGFNIDGNIEKYDYESLDNKPPLVTDEQVSSAVSEWIEANPDKMTTVQDGSVTQEKLSDDVYEKVMGDVRHTYTEEVIPLINYSYGNDNWELYEKGTNQGTGLFLTPQKMRITNPSSVEVIVDVQFSPDDNIDNAVNAETLREFTNWVKIPANETVEFDTFEYGRTNAKYVRMRWSNYPKPNLVVTAIYDSVPFEFPTIEENGEYIKDLPMQWAFQGLNSAMNSKTLFCVVPFYPNTDYYVRGAFYNGQLVKEPLTYALLDDSIFTVQVNSLVTKIPYYKNPTTTEITSDTPNTPTWIKVTTKSAEEMLGAKYLCIAMYNWTEHDEADILTEEQIQEGIEKATINGNRYVTRFDVKISRGAYDRICIPNPEYTENVAISVQPASPFYNSKWVLFGDSLTDSYGGHDFESGYFAPKIAKELGLNFDNRAKSGSNIYAGGSGNYVSVSGIVMLDAYLAEIEAGTTEQADYITVAFGTNTFKTDMGTNEDTSETHTSSVYGATKYFIEKIREKVPNAVLGFVLSPRQDWGNADAQKLRDVDGAREAIKTVCEEYGVPYIDMSTQSGITVDMLPDGIHIKNDQSQKLYYHAMRRFMIGL